MEKLLITGRDGFLASRLAAYLEQRSGERRYEIRACSHSELDITDKAACVRAVWEWGPDCVFHAAAVSDVAACEKDPDFSYRINVEGTKNIAAACRETGAKLLFMSSDQVYGGADKQGPLEIEDALPVNAYARQKLQAERSIQNITDNAVCLRLSWLYDVPGGMPVGSGMPVGTGKPHRDFLSLLTDAVRTGTPLRLYSHQYRGITDVYKIIENLPVLLRLPAGVYNAGNENAFSTYELGGKLSEFLKERFGVTLLVEADEERFRENPQNLVMKNSIQEIDFSSSFEDLSGGLTRFYENRKLAGAEK